MLKVENNSLFSKFLFNLKTSSKFQQIFNFKLGTKKRAQIQIRDHNGLLHSPGLLHVCVNWLGLKLRARERE